MERVLTGEEMLQCHLERSHSNVPNFGEKSNSPDDTWIEKKQIESRLSILHGAISAAIVGQRSQMSEAVWDAERCTAVVTKPLGKHWDVMGRLCNNELCLSAEETLFLMESNAIDVRMENVTMSLHQGYEVMLKKNACSLEEYLAYAHLVKLGYKVVRHQGDLGISPYEKQLRLDHYRTKSKISDKRKFDDSMDDIVEVIHVKKANLAEDAPDIADNPEKDVIKDVVDEMTDQSATNSDIVVISSSDESSSSLGAGESSAVSSGSDDIEVLTGYEAKKYEILDSLPNCYGKSSVEITVPPAELLPFRGWPKKPSYKVEIEADLEDDDVKFLTEKKSDFVPLKWPPAQSFAPVAGRKSRWRRRRNFRRHFRSEEDPIWKLNDMKSITKTVHSSGHLGHASRVRIIDGHGQNLNGSDCRNEKFVIDLIGERGDVEHVEECQDDVAPRHLSSEEDEKPIPESLTGGPLSALWNGQTVPLLRPSDALSTAKILSHINLTRKFGAKTGPAKSAGKFKISFDMYGPEVHFRKSSPCLPNGRIVVCKPDSPLPTNGDLSEIVGKIRDKVPLVFAVVNAANIAFYSFFPLDLPTMVTKG